MSGAKKADVVKLTVSSACWLACRNEDAIKKLWQQAVQERPA